MTEQKQNELCKKVTHGIECAIEDAENEAFCDKNGDDLHDAIELINLLARECSTLRARALREKAERPAYRDYDVEELELAVILLHQYGITGEDLHKCIGNFACAVKILMEVENKKAAEAIAAMSDSVNTERENQKPLTCDGCKHIATKYSNRRDTKCLNCSRGIIIPDHYEPKGAAND